MAARACSRVSVRRVGPARMYASAPENDPITSTIRWVSESVKMQTVPSAANGTMAAPATVLSLVKLTLLTTAPEGPMT